MGSRGGFQGLEAKCRRDLMSQNVVTLRSEIERERAAARLCSVHLAAGGRTATTVGARSASEHGLQHNLVFTLAEADAELFLLDCSDRARSSHQR